VVGVSSIYVHWFEAILQTEKKNKQQRRKTKRQSCMLTKTQN
jgi:hypothetical protein